MILEPTKDRLLSTREAAKKVGLTKGRICQLIRSGTISAFRAGNVWLIPEKELEKIKSKPPVGRPRSGEKL